MNKRLLAVLLALTVTMTGISFPDDVFAAQEDQVVIQEEGTETESNETTESEETENSETTESEETENSEETESEEIEELEEIEDTEASETETKAVRSDLSVEGTDSVGELLAEELVNVASQQEENNGCNVFSIDVSEDTATVYFETTQDATLVVAVYDENGSQMLAYGKKEVTQDETIAVVDIDSGSMPQYFLVRGYLIETETLRPICTGYESSMYTQEMQEFLSKTTDDFDEEKVLNLDEDTTNNFAVYSDDTIIIPESAQNNQVVSVDDTNRVYVIENADDTVTSLQKGDIFSHEYGEGDVLIVKVASIQIDGTTVTITGADTSAEEVFDYVKVDSTAGLGTAEIDDSNLEDGVTYEGLADMSEEDDIETYALVDGDASASMGISMKINLWTPGEKERVKVTGDVSLKMTTSIKVYIAANYQYFEFRMDYKAKMGIGISGKGRLRDTKFPQIVLRPLPAVRVGYSPSLEFSANVKCEFSGTIKGTVGMAVASDDTEIKSFDSTPKVDADLDLEGTIFLGFAFEPKISAEIVKVELASASLEGKIGAESVSKASLVGKKDDTIHDCERCIQGEIFAKGSVSIKVELLKLEFKYDMLEMKVKCCDWYKSAGKKLKFTTCPNYKYKITVATIDDSGKVLPGSKVEGDFSVITGQGTPEKAQFIKTGEDGKAVGYLPEGNYKLKISADGYKTVTKKITVKKDTETNRMRVVLRKSGDDNSGNPIDTVRPALTTYPATTLNLGGFYSGAIAKDGSLYMWGSNWGMLGDGSGKDHSTSPKKIMDNVIQVSFNDYSSGAVTKDGSLYVWGETWNCASHQFGNDIYSPQKIMDDVIFVSMGDVWCSGAITKDGSLYMWGENDVGQLGVGDNIEYSETPVKVMDHVKFVSADESNAAAITDDGELYMWGENTVGQLGDGTNNDSYKPKKVMEHVKAVSLGKYGHSGAITEDGSLYMWGNNCNGQLGDGTTNDRNRPVKIMDHVAQLSLGADFSGAITEDGSLYMWGNNFEGKLGNGVATEDRDNSSNPIPLKIMDKVVVVDLASNFTKEYAHAGAITEDGSLYMWGDNGYGQLGIGNNEIEYIASPTKVTIPGGVALPSDLKFNFDISTQSEDVSMDSVVISDTALDATQQPSETEIADQSELPEEDAVSVFEADATETDTATGTQTASFKNLTPNDTYNFYVARSLTADDLLASDNILDIRQAAAGEDGTMTVTYQPRETDDNAVVFVVGSAQKDLSGAQITFGDTTYNGTTKSVIAMVSCNGKTLVEGRDYLVTDGFEITGVGTYTLTITGTGTYTGTASAAYTVTCQHNYTERITKQPTCAEPGEKTLICSICGAVGETIEIPKTAHTYQDKKVTKRATTSKNGIFTAVCSVCGAEQTETIYAAKTIKLSKTAMTYNGKSQKPSVEIMDANGNKLESGTDYKVTYPKKTKNVGKYTLTITLQGSYTGTVKKTFTIQPKNTAISKLTAKKNTVTVKWKKQAKQTAGYELQYSTSSKFTKKTTKTVKIAKNKVTSKKIAKLKAKKKYYVRIRTYQTVKVGKKSTKIYSDWSKAKAVTTKKK